MIEFKDMKIGQHAWAVSNGKLLMVAKLSDSRLEVCGAWECGISENDCTIIELVNPPVGHESTPLYYIEGDSSHPTTPPL